MSLFFSSSSKSTRESKVGQQQDMLSEVTRDGKRGTDANSKRPDIDCQRLLRKFLSLLQRKRRWTEHRREETRINPKIRRRSMRRRAVDKNVGGNIDRLCVRQITH